VIMLKNLLMALILLAATTAASQDEVSIQIALSRDTISINEQVYLTITVSSSRQDLPKPELPNLSMFNVYSQGTSTNISIVNGKMTSSYSSQYLLQPIRQGTFPIRPVTIAYNQKRYQSNELVLTVLSSGAGTPGALKQEAVTQGGQGKDMFLTAELNKKTAYVNEQVTLTIKYFHAVQLYSQPEYTAPQTTDFWSDVLDPQKSYYQIINGRRYNVVEITTALFPTRAGDLTIGPAMVSAMVAVKKAPQRNDPFSIFDDFFTQSEQQMARSQPLTLKALPLPTENKPSGFTGTVGNYTINATADKNIVEMNQPVTVTYKINGTGNIKTVAEPGISESQDFRIYRASTDEKISKIDGQVGGTKIFEEVFIPKRAGQLTIPPVTLDFFDPKARKYKSISTGSIALEVHPGAATEYAGIPVRPSAGGVIDADARNISYIKTDPGRLRHQPPLIIFTPLYLLLNGLPVLILAALWINQKRKEKYASDIGYARSRSARKLARKHLSEARRMAHSEQTVQFYAELRRAVFSYVANKMNVSAHGLTGDTLLDILKSSGVEGEIVEKTGELLRRADFAQYSSADTPQEKIADSLRMAEEILVRLEETKIG
jgi:hypothetical protein